MKIYTLRLHPGQKLRSELLGFAAKHNIGAGFVLTCVGGLSEATLRMAGATPQKQDIRTINQKLEIVSLVGTLSQNDCHLHLSVSDKEGQVIGGHLKDGTVALTAEIVIGEDPEVTYKRELDEETGFSELVVEKK